MSLKVPQMTFFEAVQPVVFDKYKGWESTVSTAAEEEGKIMRIQNFTGSVLPYPVDRF